MFVLIFGNPIDGLELIGPFDDSAAAIDYAENRVDPCGMDWWIAQLNAPIKEHPLPTAADVRGILR